MTGTQIFIVIVGFSMIWGFTIYAIGRAVEYGVYAAILRKDLRDLETSKPASQAMKNYLEFLKDYLEKPKLSQ